MPRKIRELKSQIAREGFEYLSKHGKGSHERWRHPALAITLLDGGAPRFDNQVAWARFYLVKEGVVDSSKRGIWSLSDRGREIESLSLDESLAIFQRIHSEFQPEKVSEEATAQQEEEAVRDGVPPIELVHGDKLLDMFENLELGLTPRKTYDVDHHFFREFQV
jgi:restriction endonuclease Mrr